MNTRRQSLIQTGGRTPSMTPRHVPVKTKSNEAAGPPFNNNQVQLTSDANGQVDTSEWMHSNNYFGHACHCGED